MTTVYNPLIFGKDQTERIVSVEVIEDKAILFLEQEDGTIETKEVPNKFWLLHDKQVDKRWVRLKGESHYKYGRQFSKFSEYCSARSYLGDSCYGIWDKVEALLVKDGYTYFKGMKFNEVSILSFDIETVGLEHNSDSKVLLIANTYRDNKGNITRKMFSYDDYETPKYMIDDWCSFIREKNPSILVGHNIYGFDIPYLEHIASLNNTKLKLGRDGSALSISNRESRFRKDGSQTIGYNKVRCFGRSIIDTMFLAIKYDVGRKYESYRLKEIIRFEGLEKEDRTFYDAAKIRHNYLNKEEWQKIKTYAEEDGDDSLALYDLMIPSIFYFTRSIPKPFQVMIESATGSQLNSILIRSYLQQAASIPKATEITEHVSGGISFAIPGIYKNLVKYDLKSAYPSQIRRFKLYDKEKDPNGYFLEITEYFTKERLENKRMAKETGDAYYKDLEQSGKVGINSLYGLTNTPGLNFNSPMLASKITLETRNVIDAALIWASGKGKDYWMDKFKKETNEK